MKVGNLVNGLAVVDVKRVNKMNIIQFTKAVSEYIDQGYKIDVNSARQIGLVLQVDCYKLEQPFGGVDSVEPELETEKVEETVAEVTEQPKENVAVEPVEDYKTRLEKEGFSTNFIDGENKEEVDMKDSEVPVKKPTQRTKKTT